MVTWSGRHRTADCFLGATTRSISGKLKTKDGSLRMVMLNGDGYVPFLTKMLTDPSHPTPPLEPPTKIRAVASE